MENSFVKIKTSQDYVLISQELLSPRSQDADQLHLHDSPLDVAPQYMQHGDASQHSFALLDTAWPGPRSEDFCPTPKLEHSQSCSQMSASHSNTQRPDHFEEPADQYYLRDLSTECLSLGLPMFATQSQQLWLCDTDHYTDSLGIVLGGTEPNDIAIELPTNEGLLLDGWVETESSYWDSEENSSAKLNFQQTLSGYRKTHSSLRETMSTCLSKGGAYRNATKRRMLDDVINNGKTRCDIKEATAQTTTEYISRRQTKFTSVGNLSTDKNEQKRMSRIRGKLVHLEHQARAHAKQQLDAVQDSNHRF